MATGTTSPISRWEFLAGVRPRKVDVGKEGDQWVQTVQLPPFASDSFGRLRTSNPETLLDAQFQYTKQSLMVQELTSGTASSTHSANDASVNMTVGTASGDRIVRQSVAYLRYQPGKSQYIKATSVFGAAKVNVTKLVGYGDDDNGIFVGQDSSGMFIMKRSKSSGSVVDTKVYQSDWNVDPMTGAGSPTGVTLDPTKSQIVLIDLQFLGVGRVRVGFDIDGEAYLAHVFNHANVEATTYMTTANLPVRYEIVNTGTAASSTTLKQICFEVESEGGQKNISALPISHERLDISMGNGVGNIALLAAFRLRDTFNSIVNRATFVPKTYIVLANGGTVFTQVLYNPTITGGTWTNVNTNNSIVEVNTTATYSGGIRVNTNITPAGSIGATVPNAGSASLTDKLPFGLDISGTAGSSTTLAIVGYASTTSVTGDLFIDWEEIY